MEVVPGTDPLVVKSISGGYLARPPIRPPESRFRRGEIETRAHGVEEWAAMEFGWKVAKHVKSNRHCLRTPGRPVAAVARGNEPRGFGADRRPKSAASAGRHSRGFRRLFPLPGWRGRGRQEWRDRIHSTRGSMRDDVVIEAADRLGVAMVFTGVRHFRH